MGGIGLSDPSQGHLYQLWKGEVLNIRAVYFSSPNTSRTFVFSSGYAIQELSITFDQNMRPYAAYSERGQAKMYWYDSVAEAPAVFSLPLDARNPKITLDDKRASQIENSDVVLAYMRGTTLYVRYQRDRFSIEYPLRSNIDGDLLAVGFTDKYRLEFMFGKRMTDDEMLNGELAKGSPIASSTVITKDLATTPSDSDIWELERKD